MFHLIVCKMKKLLVFLILITSNLYGFNDSWILTHRLQFGIIQTYNNDGKDNIFLVNTEYLFRANYYSQSKWVLENSIRTAVTVDFVNDNGIKVFANDFTTRHSLTYNIKSFDTASSMSGLYLSTNIHYKHNLFSNEDSFVLLPLPFTIITSQGLQFNNKNNDLYFLIAPAIRWNFGDIVKINNYDTLIKSVSNSNYFGYLVRVDITNYKINSYLTLNGYCYWQSKYDFSKNDFDLNLDTRLKLSNWLTTSLNLKSEFREKWIINQRLLIGIVWRFYDPDEIRQRRAKLLSK